jgi:uncharacterized lipoprotein YddW (UPF0748 family)
MAGFAILTAFPWLVAVSHLPTTDRPGEVRAIWVTRWDFRTAADVRRIVTNCASLGLNRIYFQVRGQADAYYRSPLEPWGEELGGKDPGFDPLRLALEEARARRVELHAWANVLCGWKDKKPPRSRDHVYYTHPDWFLLDRGGKRHRLGEHYTMLNPCLPQVRGHIVAVMADIVRRYDIDGLHLDYIRFFGLAPNDRGGAPYDPVTLALFRRQTGTSPAQAPTRWDDFRRSAVDTTVHEIARTVRRLRPRCRLSAAVVSDFERARRLFFQDPVRWLNRGWVERLVPMHYQTDHAAFTYHTSLSLKRGGRQHIIPGIGAYRFRSAHDLRHQIEISRRLGCEGFCLFAYTAFYPSPSHASENSRAAERLRSEMRHTLRQLVGATRRGERQAPRSSEPSERHTHAPSAPDTVAAGAK